MMASTPNNTFWSPLPRVSGERTIGWDLSEEDLAHIPAHWLSYPEPQPIYYYLLGILYIFYTISNSIGNGLVIWIFSTSKSLRTPSNMFVINLALCDFLMMTEMPIFIYNSFSKGYALGKTGCKIYGAVGSFSGIGAAATNALIAYDRYRVIAKPFARKITHCQALFYILLVWLYITPWSVIPLFEQWSRFVPEGFLISCSFDYITRTDEIRGFVVVLFIVCYVIPLSLIIYFYSQIVSHVIIHEHTLREQAKKMNVESLRGNASSQQTSAEIRIAKAAITICFLFVAAWTPYAVLALIGALGNQELLTPAWTMFPACACKAVSCIDPYIYAISHPKYRVELAKRFPSLDIQEKSISQSDAGSTVTQVTNEREKPSDERA